MIKSDYEKYVSRESDPYSAWINEFEEKNPGREIEGDVSALISALGYTVFMMEGGSSAPLLYEYVSEAVRKYSPEIIYTDEDVVSSYGIRSNPYFKPDFSPDTLKGFFFMGGLLIISNETLEKYCSFSERYLIPNEINPDNYDFFADLAEYVFNKNYAINSSLIDTKILHIPHVLYHSPVQENYHYNENRKPAVLEKYDGHKVSVIILSKDNPGILMSCIGSLLRNAKKSVADDELEIIVVDNGSNEENRETLNKMLPLKNVQYYYHPMNFEYSTLCNYGAKCSSGDFLLFLNDDVLFSKESNHNIILHMLTYALNDYTGAVGIKLLFPGDENYSATSTLSNTGSFHAIQHAGISMMDVGPSHKLATFTDNRDYYFGRNTMPYNYLAVTGACLMVSKEKFNEVGGFDEILKIAYTDVDLCLDLFEKGYYSVCLNDIYAFHFESLSRGNDVIMKDKANRLKHERNTFFKKHTKLLERGDIFIGPNITKLRLDYSVDYSQEWERLVFNVSEDTIPILEMKSKGIKTVGETDILGHIDRVNYVASSSDVLPSYYEIEGWMIVHGRDQLNFDMYLAVSDSRCFRYYPVSRKYRKDLEQVFPKEKNTAMSGFIIRLNEDEFERFNAARLGLLVKDIKGGLLSKGTMFREMENEICLGSQAD